VIREADNGSPADPLIKQWREEVCMACGEKAVVITNTIDTPELTAYLTGHDYHAWPIQGLDPVAEDSAV